MSTTGRAAVPPAISNDYAVSTNQRSHADLIDSFDSPGVNDDVLLRYITYKQALSDGKKDTTHIGKMARLEMKHIDNAMAILAADKAAEVTVGGNASGFTDEDLYQIHRKFGRSFDGVRKLSAVLKNYADEKDAKDLLGKFATTGKVNAKLNAHVYREP